MVHNAQEPFDGHFPLYLTKTLVCQTPMHLLETAGALLLLRLA